MDKLPAFLIAREHNVHKLTQMAFTQYNRSLHSISLLPLNIHDKHETSTSFPVDLRYCVYKDFNFDACWLQMIVELHRKQWASWTE